MEKLTSHCPQCDNMKIKYYANETLTILTGNFRITNAFVQRECKRLEPRHLVFIEDFKEGKLKHMAILVHHFING